jgi:hypothetical protein
LYCSLGSLDLTCAEPLSLGTLKRLLCAPILLSYHSQLLAAFDLSYQNMLDSDPKALQYVARHRPKHPAAQQDPDDAPLSFKLFQKLLQTSPLKEYLQTSKFYGKRDHRVWTTMLEDELYHPILIAYIRVQRRVRRNEDVCKYFIATRALRRKKAYFSLWTHFRSRRLFLRLLFIGCELRASLANYSLFFDHWRKVCIEHLHAVAIQRIIRGFIARRRRNFIRRLQRKVTLIQKTSRQAVRRKEVDRERLRRRWAATTIQRVYRGRLARKRVACIIEARFDSGMRMLEQRRKQWIEQRRWRAALGIQALVRRFLRRRRTMKKLALQEMQEEVTRQMKAHAKEVKKAMEVYKQQVSRWYIERKERYDRDVVTEQQTWEEKKKILFRRLQRAAEERERKRKEHEEREAKMAEERLEVWLRKWEVEIQRRAEAHRVYCRNCLALPENPDQVAFKKLLQKRIKVQVKDVLRRADKARLAMEIPQAQTQATEEIIEQEVQTAIIKAKEDMKKEGERLEAEQKEKIAEQKRIEEAAKRRQARWAVVTIQSYVRVYLARRLARREAYQRYRKHFDIECHEYFYEDRLTGETSWTKPRALGSYDLDADNHWIVLRPRSLDLLPEPDVEYSTKLLYYYNPATWHQRWTQPAGTVLCQQCQQQFVTTYLMIDQVYYCDACLYQRCEDLIYTHGLIARDINLYLLNGGREDAEYISLSSCTQTSYAAYTQNFDSDLRMTEAEERRLQAQEAKEAANKPKNLYCVICTTAPAAKHCEDCDAFYCRACSKAHHKARTLKFHFIVDLYTLSLPSIGLGNGNNGKEKKKKKKKKHKKDSGGESSPNRANSSRKKKRQLNVGEGDDYNGNSGTESMAEDRSHLYSLTASERVTDSRPPSTSTNSRPLSRWENGDKEQGLGDSHLTLPPISITSNNVGVAEEELGERSAMREEEGLKEKKKKKKKKKRVDGEALSGEDTDHTNNSGRKKRRKKKKGTEANEGEDTTHSEYEHSTTYEDSDYSTISRSAEKKKKKKKKKKTKKTEEAIYQMSATDDSNVNG